MAGAYAALAAAHDIDHHLTGVTLDVSSEFGDGRTC
jgi:hypothetical protein